MYTNLTKPIASDISRFCLFDAVKKARKSITVLTLAFLAIFSNYQAVAVTTTVGVVGTTASTGNGPIYRSSATSSFHYSKFAYVYTASEMAAAGILPGAIINSISFNKATTGVLSGTNTGNFTIFVKNDTDSTLASGSTWGTLTTGATQVVTRTFNAANNFPATTGYMVFTFTTPQLYTGGAFKVFTDFELVAPTSPFSSAAITWLNNTTYTPTKSLAIASNVTLSSATTLTSTNPASGTAVATWRPNTEMDFTPAPPCTGLPNAGTITPSVSNKCFGQSQLLTGNGLTIGTGIVYQWQSSNVAGGPYTDISGANSANYNPGALAVGTYYYVLKTTCTPSGLDATSPEASIVINALPNVSAATTSTNVCIGTSATLTASSTDAISPTYGWAPSGAATNTVAVSPNIPTSYIVTATNAAGCTATAAVAVGATVSPVLSTISANPTSICVGPGISSTLSITPAAPLANLAKNYSFSAATGAFTSIASDPGATQITAIQTDDATATIPVGFTFNFEGTAYTQVSPSSNGMVALGAFGTTAYDGLNTVGNIIAPFWEDAIGTAGQARYVTSGTAPNRVLTIEWLNWQHHYTGGGTAATLSYQVKLYETSNIIQIVYRPEAAALVPTVVAQIGISGAVPATNFVSVNGTTTAATTSTVTITNNSTKPTNGLTYTFSPPVAQTLSYDWQPVAELDPLGANNTPSVSATLDGVLNSGVSGSVTFTVTATNAAGCTATKTTSVFGVVTGGTPIVTATATPTTICQGSAAVLNASIADGGAPFNWKVENATGVVAQLNATNSTTYSLSLTPSITTTYTVSCEDFCYGQSVTTVLTITVNPAPALTATPASTLFCGTTPVTITAGGATTYTWTPAAGLSATNTATVAASPVITTSYTVIGADAIGCSTSTNVLVNSSQITAVTGSATPASVCAGGNSVLTVNDVKELAAGPQTAPTAYCAAQAASPGDEDVINVTFGALNNSTTCNNTLANAIGSYGPAVSSIGNFYSDFTNAPAPTVTAGGTVPYSVTTGYCANAYYSNVLKIFIDFNRDGDFADAGEEVVSNYYDNTAAGFPAYTGPTLSTGTITIPATASAGVTRMRVRSFETTVATANTPCGSGGYGEVEDYNINIIGQISVAPTNIVWSPATYLGGTVGYSQNATAITADQTYTITATNAAGCSTTGSIAITAGSVFTMLPITSSATTVCAGTSVTLTANAAGGGQPYTYSWDNGATTNTISVSPLTTTTYTVTTTDNCAATGVETFTINVNPLPVLTLTPTPANALICNSGSVALNVTGADTYSWSPASGLSNTNTGSVNATVLGNATYTVVGTNSVTGCTSSTSQAVNFGFIPTIGASALNTNVCTGSSTFLVAADTITSGASSIIITEAIFFNGGTNTGVIPAYATGGGDFVEISNISNSPIDISGYNYSDYNTSGSTTPFHTLTFPNGTIIPGKSSAVVHMGTGTDNSASRYFNTGGPTDNYSSGSTGYAFILKKPNGTIADVVANGHTFAPALGVAAGDWTGNAPNVGGLGGIVRNVAVDNNNATDFINSTSITLSLGVYNNTSAPTGTYQGDYNSPLNFNSNTVTWANATNLAATSGYTVATNNLTASETFTVTTTTAAGCSATSTVNVTVGDPLVCASITSSLSVIICEGQTSLLTAGKTGGGAPFTYTFVSLSNNTTVQTGATNTFNASPIATETYVVTVADGCGNSCTQSITITVNPKPIMTLTPTPANALICGTGNVALAITGADTYAWSPAAGLSATTGAALTANPALTTTYTVVGTNTVTGCTNTMTQTVTASNISTISASANPSNVCVGNGTTLTATNAIEIVAGPQTQPLGYCSSQAASPGDEDITNVTFGSLNNTTACSNTLPNAIGSYGSAVSSISNLYSDFTNAPAPTVTAGGTVSYSVTTEYCASNYYSNVLKVFIDYNRDGDFADAGEEVVSNFYNNATAGFPTYTGPTLSTGTITIPTTVTAGITRMRVRSYETTIATDNTPCGSGGYGEVEDYVINIIVPSIVPAANVTWTPATYLLSTSGYNVAAANVLASETYTVTATNASGCTATASVSISAGSILTVQPISATSATICVGTTTTLTANAIGGGQPYIYAWDNGATTQNNPVAPTTTTTYTLTLTDACGTSATETFTVNVNTLPVASVSATPANALACNGVGVTLDATNTAAVSYAWSPSTGLSATNTATVSATPAANTNYMVTITDANGCTAAASLVVASEGFNLALAGTGPVCPGSVTTLTSTITPATVVSTPPSGYCTASAGCDEALNSFSFANLSNTSGCVGGYVDNTAQIANVIKGQSYTLTSGSTNYYGTSDAVFVWIDYNKNSVFESTELTSMPLTNPTSATITIPTGALSGLTRMRVRMSYNNAANPCGTQQYGEIEDYSVNISNPAPSGITFAYSNGITGTSAVESDNPMATTVYTVTATTPAGCAATATLQLVVYAPPTVTATATNSIIAVASTTNLTGNGAVSYAWTPSTEISGASNAAVALAAPTGAVGTTQTYNVTGTDANGCTASASTTINIVNALVFDPAGINGTGTFGGNIDCNGGTTDINYSLTNATPPVTVTINGTTVGSSPVAGYAAGSYTLIATDANSLTASTIITITQPTALTMSGTVTSNVSCNGGLNGSAYVVVAGGTAPYLYLWTGPGNGVNDSLAGSPAGVYTVEAYDANFCTISTLVTITEPTTAVTATINAQTDVLCFGGSTGTATISGAGGVAPYTYSWMGTTSTSNMVTNLATGSYTATITDANGCTESLIVSIGEPGPFGGAATSTPVTCNNASTGSATFNVTGGIAPYSYLWDNASTTSTISNLPAGTYTVLATDFNGCTTTGSVTLVNPTVVAISSVTATSILCNGGTADVTITSTGGTGSYTVTPSTMGITAGSYTFVSTDANGCSASTMVTITEPAILSATASTTSPLCNGLSTGTASTNVNGGTSPYNYAWSNNTTAPSLTGVSAGSYTCNITDANGCSTSVVATITEPTAVTIFSVSSTAILCAGGTSDVSISSTGGTGTLTTMPSTMGKVAGTYTFTVTDINGCTAATVVTITEPTSLALTATSIDASCLGIGGSITTSTTGGTAPVTISINGSAPAANYPVGSYTVVATDNNSCSQSTIVNVNAAVNMSITATGAAALCNGALGSIAYTTTGGAAPIATTINSISSMTSPYATASGTYTVLSTDAQGCTISTTVIVPAAPSMINITNVNKSNITCGGLANGTMQIIATGGTGMLSYSLAPATGTSSSAGNFSGLASGTYTATVTDANGCTKTTTATVGAPAVLAYVPNVIYAPSYCTNNDGIISVWANGGTGSKTYTILPTAISSVSGSFNALAAGTYTVNATDANGCSLSTIVVLANTPAITIANAVVTNPSCANLSNGTAVVTATGGTPNLTYSISPSGTQTSAGSFNGLTAGTYVITVKDGRNCTLTTSVVIANPTALSVGSPVAVSPSCNGGSNGSIVANATGGTMPYSYVLTPTTGMMTAPGNFINLTSKIYVVKVTDANGCTSSKALPLIQPAKVAFTSITKTNVKCNGGSNGAITALTTGGTGLKTLTVSPVGGTVAGNVVSGLSAATYTLTATDIKACTATTAVVLTQPTALSISTLVLVNPTAAANGSIVISATGGTGTKTYGLATGGTQTAPGTFSGLSAGTYTLTVTDANLCTVSTMATLTQATAIVENGNVVIKDVKSTNNANFTVYPNPTNGPTTVSVNVAKESTLNINVLDANGRKVKTIVANVQAGENNVSIDLTDLINGTYVMQMQIATGEAANKLIQKK